MNDHIDNAQLTTRVLDIVRRVQKGTLSEDDQVELKREFVLKDQSLARDIAGACNAARGADVLFLFGVDEKAASVPGVARTELADWWPSLEKYYKKSTPPEPVRCLNIAVDDSVNVAAVTFKSDRAPYVVSWGQGQKTRDVPFRSLNTTRSATQSQLTRILAARTSAPTLEILGAETFLTAGRQVGSDSTEARIDLALFVTPPNGHGAIVIPEHRIAAELEHAPESPSTHGTVALHSFRTRDTDPRTHIALRRASFSQPDYLHVIARFDVEDVGRRDDRGWRHSESMIARVIFDWRGTATVAILVFGPDVHERMASEGGRLHYRRELVSATLATTVRETPTVLWPVQ